MEHQPKPLLPRRVINIAGRISYSKCSGAWNILRFKNEFIKEFSQLKEKRSKFFYKMKYLRNFEDLENTIKEIKKYNDSALPLLIWLYREKE